MEDVVEVQEGATETWRDWEETREREKKQASISSSILYNIYQFIQFVWILPDFELIPVNSA